MVARSSVDVTRDDHTAARRATEACRRMLDDLGVEPEPDTRLVLALVDGEGGASDP